MSDTGSSRKIEVLVNELSDFRTRSRARIRLVMIGTAAVPALARALSSPVEGVGWSAAKTLGDIGGDEAIEALIGGLGVPSVKDVALEALRRVTGRDLGDNADAWRKSLVSGGTAAPAAATADEDLARSLTGDRISVEKSGTGYTFSVQLGGGRRQKVDMLLSLKDADGSQLVAFYTECGPATPDKYEWALKTNLKVPFGSIAVGFVRRAEVRHGRRVPSRGRDAAPVVARS